MLYVALVISAILLLVVSVIAWRAEHPVGKIVVVSILVGGLTNFNGFIFLNPVFFQALLVCALALIWGATRQKPSRFVLLSGLATLGAFLVPSYHAFEETTELQEMFAYRSMDDRLSPPRAERRNGELPAAASERLKGTESVLDEKERDWPNRIRKTSLKQIHENAVHVFVSRPGFGVTRAYGMEKYVLRNGLRPEEPTPQPGPPAPSPWLPEQLETASPSALIRDTLLAFHVESVVDFVNVVGFGYIKDRQHVAGFLEHQISRKPTPERSWKLQRLDLVGLVIHEKPTVYVSDNLPI